MKFWKEIYLDWYQLFLNYFQQMVHNGEWESPFRVLMPKDAKAWIQLAKK
jgi:hypothetical protein